MLNWTAEIRIVEELPRMVLPAGTQTLSCTGDACVLTATEDFTHQDLNLIRRQFPHRHVTLDGDVITVWPRPKEEQ
ncbi:hypothetical protein [Streptomyces sp. NPDC086766]|uniref:hypothetical protein n=1 Tax=Streptomyces sp. NPDC086766 TaxID=3365754 RepID=UPI003815159B